MKSGVLYDFKRSFLRPSLVTLIVLFIAGAVGLAYLEISTIGLTSPQYYLVYGHERSMPYSANSNELMMGYLANQYGQGIGDARVYLGRSAFTTNATGYFAWNTTPASPLPFGRITFEYRGVNLTAQANFMALVNVNVASRSGTLIVGTAPSLLIYFEQVKAPPDVMSTNSSFYQNMTYLGSATSGIFRHVVSLNLSLPYALCAEVNGTTKLIESASSTDIPAFAVQNGYPTILFTSGALFAEFFPIMAFYLVYAMFVSPRSAGALEFLLARPVTKAGIFLSRYLAGFLTLITSAGVAALALGLTISPILGQPPNFTDVGILFAALASELATFYSLSYLVGVLVRRNGAFLGISIALFIVFFTGIFNLIAILENKTYLYYMYPLGIYDMVGSYATSTFSLGAAVIANPVELVVAIAAWIALPMAAALALYERQRSA
ncbi:ABC transporter permease subunit [Tardisphaera miroshnichenkoae]